MFRRMFASGAPIPGEIELEHHLMSDIKDELELMFPFVHFCVPGNSQEKEAEHLNRSKKYGVEKKAHVGVGRWWASPAFRVRAKKEHDQYVESEFSYETLVADDLADIRIYNSLPHPRKKTFEGMTRMQVLQNCINPNLESIGEGRKAVICRHIGYHTKTSVRRSMYAVVKGQKYRLSSPEIISKLSSGNLNVDAYWLNDLEGNIKDIYIYQDDRFVDRCHLIDTYNSARVEWTEQDASSYAVQGAYVGQFRAMAKSSKRDIPKVGVIDTAAMEAAIAAPVKVLPPVQPAVQATADEDDLLLHLDDLDKYRRMAKSSLV